MRELIVALLALALCSGQMCGMPEHTSEVEDAISMGGTFSGIPAGRFQGTAAEIVKQTVFLPSGGTDITYADPVTATKVATFNVAGSLLKTDGQPVRLGDVIELKDISGWHTVTDITQGGGTIGIVSDLVIFLDGAWYSGTYRETYLYSQADRALAFAAETTITSGPTAQGTVELYIAAIGTLQAIP